MIQTAVCLSYGIPIESALSYLGVGVQPPTPSWGTILNEGKEFLTPAPWPRYSLGRSSCWRCWRSTCWATDCATPSIPEPR